MNKQLQFTWMNDRQFIDKKAERDKIYREKRRNKWIKNNLIKKNNQ